jgi:hypothetical protein
MVQIAAGTYRFTSGTLMDALPPLAADHVGAICDDVSIQPARRDGAAAGGAASIPTTASEVNVSIILMCTPSTNDASRLPNRAC